MPPLLLPCHVSKLQCCCRCSRAGRAGRAGEASLPGRGATPATQAAQQPPPPPPLAHKTHQRPSTHLKYRFVWGVGTVWAGYMTE